MTSTLERWISDADAIQHLNHFKVRRTTQDFLLTRERMDDYYLALVGELFERMRDASEDAASWARLGNAFVHFADTGQHNLGQSLGIPKSEASLFAAAAFYCGGFPASAYLTLRGSAPEQSDTEIYRACFDLLARPKNLSSQLGQTLVEALLHGDMATIDKIDKNAITQSDEALQKGPDEWIPARLFEQLFKRFLNSNVRAVLPLGDSDVWTPFIESLLSRQPPSWEFFPSQIDALKQGLLVRNETFSLQMPTGAGKTALCETLLYWHAKIRLHDVAILLVPYRSLASELRYSVVKRLNKLGISARCAYGGTVPTNDEVQFLDSVRVMVATPEALSGLLGASGRLYNRISLVICDEGHLLDSEGRGVGLELLLARLRAREDGAPRFVFVSAIVPNIEEINAWLGGASDSVVRSNYRPSIAEYAVLRPVGEGKEKAVSLDMHPHEPSPTRYQVQNFLSRADFKFRNSKTGRPNTYDFTSMKTQTIAAGRKALAMGAVAVFAANKRGNQGAIGLADELVKQLQCGLSLPEPIKFVSKEKLTPVIKYLELEYGSDWLGTRIVAAGAVLHHGDIPQETREVLENLLRCGDIRLVICTNTLAEGVNLPIRTLILYSVQRRQKNGQQKNLLARDIKNLVGRAGRAGATTKGMVICANQQQWWQIEQVARQTSGETVHGALWSLVEWLSQNLARDHAQLTNSYIEAIPALYTLVDGIDATLIDLAAEEIGEDALVEKAIRLADETFASQQLNAESKQTLQNIFELRARRVLNIHGTGRINWIRETGARLRMLESVETDLFRQRSTWDDIANPLDPSVIRIMLKWAWGQADVQEAVREAYRYEESADTLELKQQFFDTVDAWLRGGRPVEIAGISELSVDDLLSVHGKVVSYVMQSTIEQGVALLAKVCEDHGNALAPAVIMFPEHLRFGVPTTVGRVLAAGGIRHRSAAVELGNALEGGGIASEDRSTVFSIAQQLIYNNPDSWKDLLGILVFQNTIEDLSGNGSEVAEH